MSQSDQMISKESTPSAFKMPIRIECYNAVNVPTFLETNHLVDFLFEHLDQFGDPKPHIRAAIEYACSAHKGKGGFVLAAHLQEELAGIVVINHTGMGGYIPENILVYIAVNGAKRGAGIGSTLMSEALKLAKGDVALHVEPDNPARKLYERLGFTNKYLEMRFSAETKREATAK